MYDSSIESSVEEYGGSRQVFVEIGLDSACNRLLHGLCGFCVHAFRLLIPLDLDNVTIRIIIPCPWEHHIQMAIHGGVRIVWAPRSVV